MSMTSSRYGYPDLKVLRFYRSESDTEDDEPLPTPSSPRVGGGIPMPPGYRTSLKYVLLSVSCMMLANV